MTQTFYDHRAQRAVADAAAEQARAAAEATRAETAIRLEQARRYAQDERALRAEQTRADREYSRAARRDERRRQRAEAKAQRRQAIREGAGLLAAAVVTRAPVVVGGIAMGAPIVIAWGGQLAFASDVMHLGPLAPALPIALEGAAWYLAFLTHRTIKAGLPAGRYRAWTWGLAGVAAAMNAWHGITKHATKADPGAGLQVGIVLALASLLGILLWELTASLAQREQEQHGPGGRSAAEIRRAAWRRVRYPRLSWAAASIQAARGDHDVEAAWRAAWIDRYGIGPQSSRRDRRLARTIVRYGAKADRKAATSGRLAIVDGSIVGRPSTETPSIESTNPAVDRDVRVEEVRVTPIRTESHALPRTEVSALPPYASAEPYGPDAVARTEETAHPRRSRTDSAPRTESLTTVDRATLVAELTNEMRAAADGPKWSPDYPALMARTGRRRSWCEKVVADARRGLLSGTAPALAPYGDEATRTGEAEAPASGPDRTAFTDYEQDDADGVGPDRTDSPESSPSSDRTVRAVETGPVVVTA